TIRSSRSLWGSRSGSSRRAGGTSQIRRGRASGPTPTDSTSVWLGDLEAGHVVLRDRVRVSGVLRLLARIDGSRMAVWVESRARCPGRVPRGHRLLFAALVGLTCSSGIRRQSSSCCREQEYRNAGHDRQSLQHLRTPSRLRVRPPVPLYEAQPVSVSKSSPFEKA